MVTGGASGLGRATALTLTLAGARVGVADLDARGGREVADMIGGHFRACDVSDLDANRELVDFTQEQCGGVDIAFLNAGVATGFGVGEDFDLARYRRATCPDAVPPRHGDADRAWLSTVAAQQIS
ncbi:SDR family NAD(P)-dependent oxidoreductase [Streptomyces sp. NBC_00996]|nr:SDR family NAD(P)-dependent oxidoreductase [Streptomyces sp. NBC_00996]